MDEEYYMREALKEAEKAFEEDEVPVGAVIIHKNKIIAKTHNQVERLKDPTAHAEIIAITQAADYFSCERLDDCILYVTIEPCPMCAGALVWAKIDEIIYGADDPKSGACGTVINIANNEKLNHKIDIRKGVLCQECAQIIKEFFQKKRALLQ
jgi:tRNA(adenine34) deaminase